MPFFLNLFGYFIVIANIYFFKLIAWNLLSRIPYSVSVSMIPFSFPFPFPDSVFLVLVLPSQRAHACWELKYWSPSTLLVCGHFIQIHSCMSISFSFMYTNNYKHSHKWLGIFCIDNSVLMRVVMITFIVLLNCILNNIALDQAPQWGKKEKNEVKKEKYHIATRNFYFSVSDYVYTLLLQTISCQVWLCTTTSVNTLLL